MSKNFSAIEVGPGTQVTLHFALSLPDGSIVDSNFESDPATFVVGDGSLMEGFERAIFGLHEGDKEQFLIDAERAFGAVNPNNLQEVDRAQFDDNLELKKGLVLAFADSSGNELPGVVAEIADKAVLIDFNHPLAGRDITFDVKILSVKPAVTH